MNKKKLLSIIVISLILFAVLGGLNMFSSALKPSAKANAAIARIKINDALSQEVSLLKSNHVVVYIVSITPHVKESIKTLNNHVWSSDINTSFTTKSGKDFYVFSAISTKGNQGCMLKHIPANEPNPMIPKSKWSGGFWDQCRDVSFDYSGRAIKNPDFAYVNFTPEINNLAPPLGLSELDGWLIVSGYKR